MTILVTRRDLNSALGLILSGMGAVLWTVSKNTLREPSPGPTPSGDGLSPLEVEQTLLGAILIDNRRYAEVTPVLQADYFTSIKHQRIYAAITSLANRGEVADPVSVKALLERHGHLAEIGGGAYLAKLVFTVVKTSVASEYARRVRGPHNRFPVSNRTAADQECVRYWETPNHRVDL